jgi:hypothetical protein
MAMRRQVMRASPAPLSPAEQHSLYEASRFTQRLYRLDDVRHWLETEAAVFNREVGKIFRETGIALLPCPVLSLNGRGQLTLSNQHPDTARIRSLCRRHPALKQRFIGLAQTALFVREAEDYLDYVQRYEALAGSQSEQRKLVRETAERKRSLVFQFAIGIDGPALFFTEGHLSWQGVY